LQRACEVFAREGVPYTHHGYGRIEKGTENRVGQLGLTPGYVVIAKAIRQRRR